MVTLETSRYAFIKKVEPDAFTIESIRSIPPKAIIKHVTSYLGEYRFNLPKDYYNLRFKDGKLTDPITDESMAEVSQRAIDLKKSKGRSSVREQAEKIGFESLNKQIPNSNIGGTIIWASPPGPKEEGYGDYGFVYFGKVEENNLGEKNIKMTAMRVEDPSIEQFRKAIYMFTGENKDFEFAEEFLGSPKVINEDIKEGYVDAILKRVFNFEPNQEKQEKFRKIINKMLPLTYNFARNTLRTREDLYALENYALELEREYYLYDRDAPLRLRDMGVIYRNEPPKVAGSCGNTGSGSEIKSNNIFNSLSPLGSFMLEDKYGSREFECPSCRKTNIRSKDELISNCQHCGKDVSC